MFINKFKSFSRIIRYFLHSKLNLQDNIRSYYKRELNFEILKNWTRDINKTDNKYNSKNLPIIDVLIPAIDRDLDVLKHTIIALKRYSKNNIANIFIVSPYSISIKDFATKNGCIYIHEDSVTDILKKDILYNVDGQDRSGWLYQQILKLNWNKISKNNYCLVFDADTILVRPQTFVDGKKIIFNCSDEYHSVYFKTIKKLLGFKPKYPLSFVSHYMLFERDSTLGMKKHIELITGIGWEKSIIQNTDIKEMSGFSEYETYGNYMLKYHKKNVDLNYWYNQSFSKLKSNSIESVIEDSRNKFKSISFHWHYT